MKNLLLTTLIAAAVSADNMASYNMQKSAADKYLLQILCTKNAVLALWLQSDLPTATVINTLSDGATLFVTCTPNPTLLKSTTFASRVTPPAIDYYDTVLASPAFTDIDNEERGFDWSGIPNEVSSFDVGFDE